MAELIFVLLGPILFFLMQDNYLEYSPQSYSVHVHDFQAVAIAVIEIWSLIAMKKVWISGRKIEYSKFVKNILLQSDQMKIQDDAESKKVLIENEKIEV
jgi:hypothetical protein